MTASSYNLNPPAYPPSVRTEFSAKIRAPDFFYCAPRPTPGVHFFCALRPLRPRAPADPVWLCITYMGMCTRTDSPTPLSPYLGPPPPPPRPPFRQGTSSALAPIWAGGAPLSLQ